MTEPPTPPPPPPLMFPLSCCCCSRPARPAAAPPLPAAAPTPCSAPPPPLPPHHHTALTLDPPAAERACDKKRVQARQRRGGGGAGRMAEKAGRKQIVGSAFWGGARGRSGRAAAAVPGSHPQQRQERARRLEAYKERLLGAAELELVAHGPQLAIVLKVGRVVSAAHLGPARHGAARGVGTARPCPHPDPLPRPSPPLPRATHLMGGSSERCLSAPKSRLRNQGCSRMSRAPRARQPYRLLRSTWQWWVRGAPGKSKLACRVPDDAQPPPRTRNTHTHRRTPTPPAAACARGPWR